LGVKRLGREADHSPPSSAEVKELMELYLHSSNTPPWRGVQLKHRNNSTRSWPYLLWVASALRFVAVIIIIIIIIILNNAINHCWPVSNYWDHVEHFC
jgi:hypothetical protein